MSYGNWKHILGVFSFHNSVFNGIFIIKHTPKDLPAATFDSLSFLFIYFSTFLSSFSFLQFGLSFFLFAFLILVRSFFFFFSFFSFSPFSSQTYKKKIKKQGWRGKGRELRLRWRQWQSHHLQHWIDGPRFAVPMWQ